MSGHGGSKILTVYRTRDDYSDSHLRRHLGHLIGRILCYTGLFQQSYVIEGDISSDSQVNRNDASKLVSAGSDCFSTAVSNDVEHQKNKNTFGTGAVCSHAKKGIGNIEKRHQEAREQIGPMYIYVIGPEESIRIPFIISGKEGEVTYEVNANGDVGVYLIDDIGNQQYNEGRTFASYSDTTPKSNHRATIKGLHPGNWYLMIYNPAEEDEGGEEITFDCEINA